MNWLYYLLEANLYLVVFYGMYKLLLQYSTFYNSNRYFLLLSVVAAFAIPFIQLGFLKPTIVLEIEEIPYEIPLATIEIATVAKTPVLTTQDYIFYGYLALALFLSLKFVISISKIVTTYLRSNKRKLNDYTLVELSSEHTAFSFFNILFIHPTMAKNEAVLKHEIVHIKHKHSWDILLLELLKICCWFNPIVYLMKKDITLLHEYIADEKTTIANISKHEYAMFLIENSMAAYSSSLVNQLFNQSILKSRINMLNKEKTANWARLKYLLAVPLGVGLLCVSTLSFSKSYGFLEIGTQKQVQQTTPKNKQEKPVYYPEHRYDEKNNFISLEKRAIIVNGKLVADKNKFFGVAEADEIKYLNTAEATKKYGEKMGKNGAVVITGKNLVSTPPPPMKPSAAPANPPKVKKGQISPPPPPIETPPSGKKLKKFPPPVIKSNENISDANKEKTNNSNEDQTSIDRSKGDKLVISAGGMQTKVLAVYDRWGKEVYYSEDYQNNWDGSEGNINEAANKELAAGTYFYIVSSKQNKNTSRKGWILIKGNSSKVTPTDNLNKTSSLKRVSNYQTQDHQKATTTKTTPQNRNNVFSKAWTLYKPKVEENKNDNC